MVHDTRRRALGARHSSRWLSSSSSRIYTYGTTALLAIAALIMLHAPGVASAAPTKIDMHAGHQLTPDTFQETIRDGIWLVEHYSPFCHHCKAFVPTWKELVDSRKHQEESINFHFGQVDCAIYGDLCDKNNVKGYPSLFLFENGEYVEQYKKERSLERLNKWLDARLPDEPEAAVEEGQVEGGLTLAEEKEEEGPQPFILPGTGSGIDNDTAEDPAPAVLLDDEADKTSAEAQRTTDGSQNTLATGEVAYTTGNTAIAGSTGLPASETGIIANQIMHDSFKSTDEEGGGGEAVPLLRVQQHHKRITPNPEGQVQHLNTGALEALLDPSSAQGPAFVKYYAPWCSHCKRLAPTWKDLASNLRSKVNVVEFNCDASENKAKCRSEGIAGYPTLVFYQGGEKAEYRGGRTLAQLEEFANKAVLSTGMRDIDAYDLQDIAQEEDVFFLYLYPSDTPASEVDIVQSAAGTLLGSAPVYKSSSPELFTQLNYPRTHPSLLVFKDHELKPTDSKNFTSLHSTSTSTDKTEAIRKEAEVEISRWLHGKKHPSLSELTSVNINDYMEDGQDRAESYVALAALSPTALGANAMRKHQDELRQTSKAWHDALRTVNPNAKPVNFVWVDADQWGKYLQSTYAIRPNRPEPLIVIVDPIRERFYPTDVNKQSIRINQPQIFQALEQLYDGRLTAIRTTSFMERSGRWALKHLSFLGEAIGNHVVLSIVIGVAIFLGMFAALIYFMDNPELQNRGKVPQAPVSRQPKYVPHEKSLYTQSHHDGGVKKD